MQFVSDVKTLLTNNIISSLQQHYGIWADGRVIPVSQLTTSNADIIYRARMLRGRLQYIKNSLPADSTDIDKKSSATAHSRTSVHHIESFLCCTHV